MTWVGTEPSVSGDSNNRQRVQERCRVDIPRRRSRSGVAAATWIFCGDEITPAPAPRRARIISKASCDV